MMLEVNEATLVIITALVCATIIIVTVLKGKQKG